MNQMLPQRGKPRRASISTAVAAAVAAGLYAPTPVRATDFLVHNAAEISTAVGQSQAGDTITMADGTWTNQNITFNDTGTAAKPITLRAQTPGRVLLNGTSKISIGGDFTVVDGLRFQDGTLASGNIISLSSSSSEAAPCWADAEPLQMSGVDAPIFATRQDSTLAGAADDASASNRSALSR